MYKRQPEANGTFFRLQSQPQETHLSLDSQDDISTPSSTSAFAVIYHSSELLRLRYSLFVLQMWSESTATYAHTKQ